MMVLTLFACGVDLPPGWEDAVPVESLAQQPCGGSPYDTGISSIVTAELAADPLTVDATAVPFRCAQDVEGFWKESGDQVDVLVQPIDMDPRQVAGCDCLYDLAIVVGSPDAAPSAVTLWRRWDSLNDPNDPVKVGEVTR
ncbi:MAG: hypothetical protein ABMA64_30840 [Myxococcota bacterium]